MEDKDRSEGISLDEEEEDPSVLRTPHRDDFDSRTPDEELRGRRSLPRRTDREEEEEGYSEEEDNRRYQDDRDYRREDKKEPEEQKKEPEELKEIEEVEREPLLQKNIVYSRERSYFSFPRAILEQTVMELPKRTELLLAKDQETIGADRDFLKKLENDGIYKIGAVAEDMVTKTLTRPIDLSLRQVYRTKIRSAILCDRLNSLKKKYFKFELLLGKIVLRDHPLFIDEDKCAIELKSLHEEFERLAGLGMIPFYESRIQSLQKELMKAEDSKKIDHDHIKFLKASVKDIRKKRNQEKKQIKDLGIHLYEKWLELKNIRTKQDFESTTVDLKAREFDLPNGKKEIVFYLNNKEPMEKTLSGKSMPSSELGRRKRIRSLEVQIDVYVNDKKVDSSRSANVSWPNFEAELGDQFILFLYTMPKSIELRISLQGKEICRIPVEIPGTKVEALTSTYAISKEAIFSRNEYKAKMAQSKAESKGKVFKAIQKDEELAYKKEQKELKEKQKKAEQEAKKLEKAKQAQKKAEKRQEAKKEDAKAQVPAAPTVAQPGVPPAAPPQPLIKEKKDKTAVELEKEKWERMLKGPDIKGFLYFKAEWKGEGADMPPAIRLLIEKEQKEKSDPNISKSKTRLIDVNDPRYEYIIRNHKENNEHLQKLIEKDSLNPLNDLHPFRHIQLINQDIHYELVNIDIPILETEVVNDPTLSYLIEKFSKLGAIQTYDQMLREVKSFSGSDRLQDMSAEALERRQKFMEKLKRVQKVSRQAGISYDSIVREVGGIQAKNPLAGLVQKIFAPRRKLRPTIKTKTTVAISQCEEAVLKVQIISGINIPVRAESIQAIEMLNRKINEGDNRNINRGPGFNQGATPAGYPPEDPYGRDPYGRDGYGRDQYGRDPYNRDQYGRDPYGRDPGLGNTYNRRLDNSFTGATPNRGPGTDFRGTRGFNRDRPLTGNNRDFGPTGFGGPGFGATGALSGAFADRNAPPYSGYGTVQNPYGTLRGGPLNNFDVGYNGNQLAPPESLRDPNQIGALAKAKMELTGINKLIQGSVFIEVRYVSDRPGNEIPQIKRTAEVKGSFPDWNETLSFKILPSNGRHLTEEEMTKNNDRLYFSIFDKHETERKVIMTNKHEITVENKFLGSFSVPLLSILQNAPKMEGHICVDRPLNLQGYGMLPSGMLSSNIFKGDIDTDLLPTYISLSINIDPLMELPAENEYDFYPGGEDAKLLRAGALWANSHRSVEKFSTKLVKVFGENVERKSILLCRYLTSQAPPKTLIDLESGNVQNEQYAIQTAARFVSLIPFIDDNSASNMMPDMWCTSQEFLDLNGGDYEEHAILLCNYFNYIDGILNPGKVKSYILLGNAVPEGYTTYVLRRNLENNHVEIWDAIRGQAYFFGSKREVNRCCGCFPLSVGYKTKMGNEKEDDENFLIQQNVSCQLKSIGCIVGDDNIWANLQPNPDPALCQFDLDNPKLWRPFLTKKRKKFYLPLELDSIDTVQEKIHYASGEALNLAYLEDDIKNYLSQKFADARINHYTRWNHSCSDLLRETMRELETLKLQTCCPAVSSFKKLKGENKPTKTSDIFDQLTENLNEIVRGKKIYGFPINCTFTNLDALWEEVKNTGMHNIVGSSVEFVLSVFVHAYPCNVISVWIYMMSLTSV